MTIFDHDQPVLLIVPFTHDLLLKSARLGGLDLPKDVERSELNHALLDYICEHARYGVLQTVQESFDRHYPLHYPEVLDDNDGADPADDHAITFSTHGSNLDYQWLPVWWGEAKW